MIQYMRDLILKSKPQIDQISVSFISYNFKTNEFLNIEKENFQNTYKTVNGKLNLF